MAWRESESPYEVLGVAPHASEADVRAAFLRAVRARFSRVQALAYVAAAAADTCAGAAESPRPCGRRCGALPARAARLGAPPGNPHVCTGASAACAHAHVRLQDPVVRAAYDKRVAVQPTAAPCTDVDLDDLRLVTRLTEAGAAHEYEHDCRCGDTICFADTALREDAPGVVFACASCSLCIRVLYTTQSAGDEVTEPAAGGIT